MSVVKALEHASMRCDRKLVLHVSSPLIPGSIRLTGFSGSTLRIWNQQQRRAILSDITTHGVHYAQRGDYSYVSICIRKADRSRGIIVPGGFGSRGTEGMIAAVKWAREQRIPFLGICLGFQVAVIEWARNVCNLQGRSSFAVSC